MSVQNSLLRIEKFIKLELFLFSNYGLEKNESMFITFGFVYLGLFFQRPISIFHGWHI